MIRQRRIIRIGMLTAFIAFSSVFATILLDHFTSGAANPWGIECSEESRLLLITHAGTHEISVIQLPQLMERLHALPAFEKPIMPEYDKPKINHYATYGNRATARSNVAGDLNFLRDIRQRMKLTGLGPRGIAVKGNRAYITNYFSGSLDCIDFSHDRDIEPTPISLGSTGHPSQERWGEFLFNDASICYQGWQSCASCHPEGGQDGLNWDLLNDGIGNPKNTKSLILSHRTPPVMSTGVRSLAELWRTAPYLHDGRAANLQELLTIYNPEDRHGVTSHLTPKEIDDLTAFLLSI